MTRFYLTWYLNSGECFPQIVCSTRYSPVVWFYLEIGSNQKKRKQKSKTRNKKQRKVVICYMLGLMRTNKTQRRTSYKAIITVKK
jgi:hypothetical protein